MKASDAIRAARALKKLKQHELAAAIGVSQQMVSEWETDREPVAMKNWPALKSVLDVDCAVLEMPQNTTTQTTTGGRAAQNNALGGHTTITMDESGITCTGLDERHPPSPIIDTDEWAELLYWIRRYPTLVPGLVKAADYRWPMKIDTSPGPLL